MNKCKTVKDSAKSQIFAHPKKYTCCIIYGTTHEIITVLTVAMIQFRQCYNYTKLCTRYDDNLLNLVQRMWAFHVSCNTYFTVRWKWYINHRCGSAEFWKWQVLHIKENSHSHIIVLANNQTCTTLPCDWRLL